MVSKTQMIVNLIFIFIFILSLIIRVAPILSYNFPFTVDQGRDMLDLRNLITSLNITLIGPTTSINGVFLGPFWYYFNAIPYILGKGNPAFIVYWLIGWYHLAALIIWFYFKRNSVSLAFFASTLFLMAPTLFYSSRYFWNANLMQVFTVFFFLSLLSCLNNGKNIKFVFLGFIAGLSLQVEAAFGVLFLPFALLVLIFSRSSWQQLSLVIGGFGITLIPQLAFEFRHNFIMTQTLIKEFTGNSPIQGVKLSFQDVYYSHRLAYLISLNGVLQIPDFITSYIFAVVSIVMLIATILKSFTVKALHSLHSFLAKSLTPSARNIFILSLSFVVFSFLAYLFYPHHLKGWYINGLQIPYLFIYASFFTYLIGFKKKFITVITTFIVILLFIQAILVQQKLIPHGIDDRSGDRSNFRNELEVIDWVYQEASGQGFKVYSYLPSVYDFPYQYLFWWYGTSKYGYQPEEVSYLKNVPEYISNNNIFWNKKLATQQNHLTFLIIEKEYNRPQLFEAWLNNFSKLCLVKEKTFFWDSLVQVRKECN